MRKINAKPELKTAVTQKATVKKSRKQKLAVIVSELGLTGFTANCVLALASSHCKPGMDYKECVSKVAAYLDTVELPVHGAFARIIKKDFKKVSEPKVKALAICKDLSKEHLVKTLVEL